MITERIDSIIARRKEKLQDVCKAKERLNTIVESVTKIKQIQERLNNPEENDHLINLIQNQPELRANIAQINTERFWNVQKKYLEELNRLEKRFGRESLNICFVGAAGQGKSMALQSITGLSSDVIPSAEGSDCTGAKSIISNITDSEDVVAEIMFYSCEEIIDIVNGYIDEITGKEKYHVYSISDISLIPIEKIEAEVGLDANAMGKMKQLRKYVEHLREVSGNIGRTIIVKRNEIEKFVAQHSCVDKNIQYYDYLCVKCANIKCSFPKKDAGKIVLVDTKGLGDTSRNVEENMLDAVENDSDAIILMYRPDPLRAGLRQNEIDILNKISAKIGSEYSKQLLYWLINRVNKEGGNNTDVIENVKKEIIDSKMPVADIIDVDCSNIYDVETKLLESVLSGLTERLDIVDQMIIEQVNDTAKKVSKEYAEISYNLENYLLNGVGDDVKRVMKSTIQQTIDIMFNGLRDIFLQMNLFRESSNEEFENAGNIKLKNVLRLVPSQDQVMALLNKGTSHQHNVYEECTNVIRIAIIDDFLDLDGTLMKIADELKDQIIRIMVDPEFGRLGKCIPYSGSSPNEWFEAFLEMINREGNNYPLISKAIRELYRFTISAEGFLIYEVRDKLDALDNSLRDNTPQIRTIVRDKKESAIDIISWIDMYLEKVHDELRKVLVDFYKVPNRALFAAAKDFFDRANYSQKDTYNTVREEWERLYDNLIPVIWEEEYSRNINNKEAYQEWKVFISRIKECAEGEQLAIR